MIAVRSVITGTGSALPKKLVTNDELAAKVDTSDKWIQERTGIKQRYIAGDDETTSTLAYQAALAALDAAGKEAADIDLIIVATATPDNTFPATATKVQAMLGTHGGIAFDVAAVCSGFIYAMTVANAMLQAGQGKAALVIGAETFSRLLDWNDRTTCVLFGDGAGAVVLESKAVEDANKPQGILACSLHADGRQHDLLYVDGGPSTTQTVGHLRMQGREVFRHAVTNLSAVIGEVLDEAQMEASDISWIVPHQANARILNATAKKLGLSKDRLVLTVDQHANTSAASVPLALDTAVRDGRIDRGDAIIMEAMGGGFTWGAILLRY